ncbi:MAG: hypothetical protein ACR2NR_12490 [Solirubrobacteraceae bacterium]
MRVNLGVRMLAVALVCAVVSLAGSAVAGAVTVRAGTYVGVGSHRGVVLIAVGPGGRAITPLSITGAAGGGVAFDRVRVRHGGRFDRKIADGEGEESVAGRITSSGLVRGHYRFFNRGGFGSGSFSARFVRGLARRGERIFSLYASDNQTADTTTNLDRSGVPATEIGSLPVGVAQLPDGRVVVVDAPGANQAVLNSATPFGIERRIGGGVQARGLGNGGPVTKAGFNNPGVVVARTDGSYLITDDSSCVRAVSPAGIITDAAGVCGTVPGGPGVKTPLGDGGPATKAHLSAPAGLAVLPDGGFLIADSGGDRVQEVSPAGIITTVAGNGRTGFSGDGSPATSARLSSPTDVAVLPGGGFLIADTGNHRVREVQPDGTIVTVAGGHPVTLAHGLGDGGPATQAAVPSPVALLVRPDGNFLIGDDTLGMIRRVTPDATISTIAGGGPSGHGAARSTPRSPSDR